MLGRKRIYGYEVLVLAFGAVASALSPNIWWLIVFRIVLGIGIGGDYPVSSTIMSEYASKKTRGMMVTLVFTMQAAGLIFGPLLAAGLLITPLSHDLIWRLLLAFGAVPAMAVFQMRRHMAETPRYLLATGQHKEFGEATAQMVETSSGGEPSAAERSSKRGSFWQGFRSLTANPVFLMRLVGASLAWAFMDFAYYGNTVSSPMVLAAISPGKDLLHHTLMQLAIFAIAAAPGYLLAAITIDRIGRKAIQMIGFVMMAVAFAAIAFLPDVTKLVIPFIIIYGVSYFFTEFGPNSTTFVYPAEIFPVTSRTTGHGIAAAAGKLGGFFGVFLFPVFMSWGGLTLAEAAAGTVSVLGAIVTLTLLPETKGKSLEELSPEAERTASASA
jgi:PHS family inorganic phosphate transporter-like MFS transporter